jgi:hypothetical protein
MQILRLLAISAASLIVAACGGGGGNPGTPSTGGGGSTPSQAKIAVAIVNSANTPVSSISVGGGFVARATLTDAGGAPIANNLVTFDAGGTSIATITPSTALTNSSGMAEVGIAPASLSAVGAGRLTATASVGTVSATGSADFAVSASSLSLSAIAVSSSNLASGGNTGLSVTALVAGAPSTGVPVNVSFTTSCGRINGQDTTSGGFSITTNGSGVAAVTYTAVTATGTLCSGPVTVTASSVGAAAKTATINIAQPVANAVAFVSATPAQIFVAGSGAAEQSVVKFKVLSSAGTALAGVGVVFSIETNPGGVGLNAAGSTAPVNATTNEAGEVTASIFSSTIPGPVKVRVALQTSPTVFAESQNLTIASGPPSQRFMSMSVETFNIEGWNRDGTSTKLTVRLADRQGNAVDDGTVVNFTAEGGQVASSCATLKSAGISSCSVDFVSQNPRPAGGRVTVLAHTSGTKDYVDVNGNNKYDAGVDTLVQMGDAYRDDNENNQFDSSTGEFVVPRGATGACTGAGGAFPSRADTCDGNLSTTVRQQAVILYSSSSPILANQVKSVTGISFLLGSVDNALLPMPAGTVVSATSTVDNCTIGDIAGSPVVNVAPTPGNPGQDLKTGVSIALKGCAAGNGVNVRVTSPAGLTTVFSFTL